MTKCDLSVVLCRLLGLYFMVNTLVSGGMAAMVLGWSILIGVSAHPSHLAMNILLPQLASFLVGLVLWRKGPSIGLKMSAF